MPSGEGEIARVFLARARRHQEEAERHEAETQKALAEQKANGGKDAEYAVTVTVKEPRDWTERNHRESYTTMGYANEGVEGEKNAG